MRRSQHTSLPQHCLEIVGTPTEWQRCEGQICRSFPGRVAWHLDHMLKVINRIHDALESSNQEDYSWSPHPLRLLVFNSGKMPRGRGKSPAVVLPPEVIETRDILDQLNEAKMKWKAIDQLPPGKWFDHYAFGQLDRDDAMRFIVIHTRHHLSIIRDILSTKPQS